MNKIIEHSKKLHNRVWMVVAVGAIALPVAGWFVLEQFLGDMESEDTMWLVARLLILVSLFCIATAGIGIFKAKGLYKVVPIVAVLLGLIVGFFAFVAHQISYIG